MKKRLAKKPITACPVCRTSVPRTKWLKNNEQSARLHILGQARSEALRKLLGISKAAPHVDYLKKHVGYKRQIILDIKL